MSRKKCSRFGGFEQLPDEIAGERAMRWRYVFAKRRLHVPSVWNLRRRGAGSHDIDALVRDPGRRRESRVPIDQSGGFASLLRARVQGRDRRHRRQIPREASGRRAGAGRSGWPTSSSTVDKTGIVLETLAPIPLSISPLVSDSASGWTDDGSVVRLAASADSVGIGTHSCS
jgi:hypothetical protein